jgi:hypothetical protein
MKLLERTKSLLPIFDALWKIGILAALIWIGQSLRDISEGIYVDSNLSSTTESESEGIPNGPERLKPQSYPSDGAVADQTRT